MIKVSKSLSRTFKLSNDKHFVEKLEDIVGLYLNPPEHAVVFSCDETSQIQALDRTQPGLPIKKGRDATMTHDDKRNGTTSLFAALNIATGEVIGTCMKKHRHQEWIRFLKQVKKSLPGKQQVHIVCDNYATHQHAKGQAWQKRNERFQFHFTPTSAAWLNMVERFFRDLTTNRIRLGVFTPRLISSLPLMTISRFTMPIQNLSFGPHAPMTSSKKSKEVVLTLISYVPFDGLH